MLEIAMSQLKEPETFRSKSRNFMRIWRRRVLMCWSSDGRVFEQFSRPQRIGEVSVGRVWSFRDVTERKRRSGPAKLHQDLLEKVPAAPAWPRWPPASRTTSATCSTV